jgi:Tol biopolymer transport system component/tRNA A-37 threonylcarbamoyl transferase component Bud32
VTSNERLSTALAGRYRIERELGQGGMATVYLAEDLRHDRKVAVKVLKPELAAVLGAERFVIEIKTTASLQHPHILPLFDSGTVDGFLFYVMPYIQGETIRDKLNRETQFGVEEAVRVTREVADALDYAHRHGVIHRDIKPENLLLHDGRAMVMDFGIALAVSAAAGGRMTETGLSLGTPHYMSPEQATAEKDLTPRADVYSLAAVLYEMLTGHPPHVGPTTQQIIMKIITEPVQPVTALRKSVPPNVTAALARALEKLPADRFDSARAFGDALAAQGFTYATVATAGAGATQGAASRGGRRTTWLALAVAAALAVVAAIGWLRPSPPEPPLRRFDLSLGAIIPTPASELVISPDGSMLAFSGVVGGEVAIYLRHLDGDPDFRMVTGTESGYQPAFSPDNQWIVFRKQSDKSLVKISVNGGGAVTLVPGGKIDPYGPHWGTDDQIVFGGSTGTFRISAAGGEAVPLPKAVGRYPFLLPDGSGLLYNAPGSGVALYDFQNDSSVILIPGGRAGMYVPTGHLLYGGSDGGLLAVPFDLARRRVEGAPVRVLERVGGTVVTRGYSVSATGVLVQYDAVGSQNQGISNRLVIVDPGRVADTVRLPPGRRLLPRFSRDGRSLVMEVVAEGRNGASDIYTLDLVSGAYTQLTFDGDNDEPVWSPDGRRILFDKVASNPAGEDLFIKPADNSGPERRLTTLGSGEIEAQQWIDDTTMLFDARVPGRAADVFTVAADSGSVPVPHLQSPFNEFEPQLSPDRTLLAFTSNETGADQVWIRDFPVPQGKWNISRGRGRAVRWSPDGRFVYFWRIGSPVDTLFRVRIDRTPGAVVHPPELVAAIATNSVQNWDLHPDGRRFVVAVPVIETAAPVGAVRQSRYLILQNWFGELRRLTGAKPR